MASTASTDLLFEPKVWSDHIKAYYDDKLVFGAFAMRNRDLQAEGTGLTVNFPYYQSIGPAEEPLETASLTVDNLSDDSFSATVFEVGKAIGFKKKAFKKTADSMNGMISEGQRQIARVHAEKVDDKLIAEIYANTGGLNYTNAEVGYASTTADDGMTVKKFMEGRINAFGDKYDETAVAFMHSKQLLSLLTDASTGFLKADANDPMSVVKGFQGRTINGTAIVVADKVPQHVAQIATQDAYVCSFHKMNAYGIMEKQDMEFDDDKDILAREIIITGNQWYAVKSFHKQVSALDKKSGLIITTEGA
jgi:hypothetical protein